MKRLLVSIVLLVVAGTGCSVEIQQTSLPTATAQWAFNIQPAAPTIIENTTSSTLLRKQIPVTWSHLNLSGRLVYVLAEFKDYYAYTVQVLDLATGEVTTLFSAPEQSIIYDLAVSPDNQEILLSYSSPSQETGISYRGIYSMPMDGSHPPQQLFPPVVEEDENYQVEWSPDGKFIYFTNFNYQTPPQENGITPLYTIYRIPYPNGTLEKIAENSLWPNISPDSSKIVYIQYVGSILQNALYVADADGSNPQEVVLTGSWIPDIIDAPIFTSDGQFILFSGSAPPQAYKPNLLDKLMGVEIARAHNVPSDWYVIPIEGGEPTRLTHIQSLGLFGSISPDEKHIASLGGAGVFVMDLDGSNLFQVLPNAGAQGAIRWIP